MSHHAARPANRLAGSSSPYLLLHAHNPVDWYPWGEEALARARAEDKPIFLSVGYSTCYWCHVMERESFSDPELAARMNRDFVNIKVDREERPDLDEVYMAATQLYTGQGGWPNSLFLTPALEPFYAGTYFPPDDKWGRPGFRTVLDSLAEAWRSRRDEVDEQAREMGAAIRHHMEVDLAPAPAAPGGELATVGLRTLAQRFDLTWGGFGEAPKFPTPSNLLLLLELADDDEARRMLAATLDQMARGGIHDQLGGGFHRYATDREWKVPHFEKMLYDNGSLLEIYARAHALLGDAELARVARTTVEFLERELSAPEGGFWSAVDAETHGHEGAFYVWSRQELQGVLGDEDATFLAPIYGFDGAAFFEGTHYVLHLPRPIDEQAQRRRVSRQELLATMEPLRARLLAARERRERPKTDDKVLADWNGLAIAGLATAGRLLGEPAWLARAERAADFVLAAMRPGGILLHVWRGGAAGDTPAFLADYAYLAHGLLALHEATGKESWLAAAVELAREQRLRLGHPDGGFYNAAAVPDLLCRTREVFDGASPSPNGIAACNLLALAERTGDASFHEEAERALRAFAPFAQPQPAAARTISVAALRLARLGGSAPDVGAGLAAARAHASLGEEAAALVRARLVVEATDSVWQPFHLRLEIADGWHVGAGTAPSAVVVATSVNGLGCELRALRLPPPSRSLDGFGEEPLPVWEGVVEIVGELRRLGDSAPSLRLVFQPCDDRRCLPAVSVDVAADQ